MAAAIWLTPAGNLGIIPEQEFYQLPLDAYNPTGGTLTYKLIAGKLPIGLQLDTTGVILGIPVKDQILGTPAAVNKVTTSTFTLRVTNSQGLVTDRTFSLTVAGLTPPIIKPEPGSLGTFVDGQYVDVSITAIESNSLLTPTFSIISGSLPPGLTLASTGRISGYINPTISTQVGAEAGFDASAFDLYGFDFIGINISKNFQFTVQASDGVNTDVNIFTIYVYARSSLTADNVSITADDEGVVTADTETRYNPVLYTTAGSIGNIRQNTRFDYKFDAVDFNNDYITYSLDSGSLPTGLSLNTVSGWITGIVPTGTLGNSTYNFAVKVYKTTSPEYVSETKSYSLRILGQIDNTVNWDSPSALGSLYNGSVSELAVMASTPSGRFLKYKLVDSIGKLPIGLTLLDDGTISGRISFQTFNMDSGRVTFDSGATSFDHKFSFTVAAYDSGNFVYDEKTFTITLLDRDAEPYENLYIQILSNKTQRNYYNDFVNNTDIIPNEYIYRPSDPWYGKNLLRRSLFLAGLSPLQVADYISAMTLNHYWKTINFGSIKTAQALDENFNVKYEVVYIELLDRQVNSSGQGPGLTTNLAPNSRNISSIHVNSFPNMAQRIATGIGYENRSILPDWMTSRQPDGKVLGFTRALVLCYTIPGRSAEIAYRVTNSFTALNLIDFTIDRYEWDSILSDSFVKAPASGTGTITSNTASTTVIGVGTDFTNQLDIGKTIYVNNVSIGNISTISNSTVLTLTSNSTTNVSSNAFTFSSNAFIHQNYATGTGLITANTSSNIVVGANSIVLGSGVISGNVGTTTINGTSTAFLQELTVGKTLYYAGNLVAIGTITSIKSNTVMTLGDPIGYNVSNVSYKADGLSTLFATELHVGDTLVVNSNVVLGTVKSITSNTQVTLNANAATIVGNVNYNHTLRDPYTIPGQGNKYLKFPQVGVIA